MTYINVGLKLCFFAIGTLAVITSALEPEVAQDMLIPEFETGNQDYARDYAEIREKRDTEEGDQGEIEDIGTMAQIEGIRPSVSEGKSAKCRGRPRRKGNGGNGGNGGGNGGNGEATTAKPTTEETVERLQRRRNRG